jgi:phage shock protein C
MDYPHRLYRSRQGWVCGVCRGFADYFNLSAGWLRVLVLVTFLLTGFWPVGVLYLVAALVMKRAPRGEYGGADETRSRLRGAMDRIDLRLRRLEEAMASRRRGSY